MRKSCQYYSTPLPLQQLFILVQRILLPLLGQRQQGRGKKERRVYAEEEADSQNKSKISSRLRAEEIKRHQNEDNGKSNIDRADNRRLGAFANCSGKTFFIVSCPQIFPDSVKDNYFIMH